MKYRHIFFDLDHTLWDFNANAKDVLIELYDHFNLSQIGVNSFDLFYSNYLVHNALLWSRYEKGFISTEELKWKRMWRTLLDFKIGDEKLAKEMAAYFLEILPYKKKVFDHTFEILDYLTEKQYSLHLITNGFERTQWAKLQNSQLNGYFKQVITSESANCSKPKKEIFEFAINKAKCNFQESIMIGDNLDADISGAMNAGMDTIFANHINAECDIKPTYIIRHLKELEGIF
ncbi:MAG: YjjG family noncanonical pyrimidine nucleotidase [Ginsengibacter sp.]